MTVANPAILTVPKLVITPWDVDSIGVELLSDAGGVVASAAVFAVTTAIYIPWYLSYSCTVSRVDWSNGATASGNVDCGVYDSANGIPTTKLVSSGAQVQTGVNANQGFDVTDTLLQPGLKFLALYWTSGTATFLRTTINPAQMMKFFGVCMESVATALPGTATPVVVTNGFIPYFSVTVLPRTLAP